MSTRLFGALCAALSLTLTPLLAQEQQVRYHLSFPNAVHHEAQISVTFTGIKSDTLQVLMPRSSPGRYALHEFAKNVYSVKATDSKGQELRVSRFSPHEWHVSGHQGEVTLSYTLFGDHADGTYTGIDETHAHLNMPATLTYARGFEQAPARVIFRMPQGSNWKVATQLQPLNDSTFQAPNFQYLMDSPTELSDFAFAEWQVQDGAKSKTIQVAMHHQGTQAAFDSYVASTKKIVAEQQAVFGKLPDFDFDRYTFIACYGPQAVGDGMEHRNSTILTSSRPLLTSMNPLLNTVSHEFFHAWNVERLRPASLEPFDFQEANMSEALWLAEGFTTYYGDLTMRRTGIFDLKKYSSDLAGDLNYVLLSPGRHYHSLVEMSLQAPFVDAARSVDPHNRHNTFISYYTYGSVLGLGLDLTLRRDFNTTLDAYMQALWQKYGQPEKPYTLHDLEQTLAEVTKDTAWAADFFRRQVYGSELPDYAALLAEAGLQVRKDNPGKAGLGMANFAYSKQGAKLMNGTYVTSPLYKAGLDRGDVILTIDGRKVTSEKEMEKIMKRLKPTHSVPLTYQRHGTVRKATLIMEEIPTLEVVPFEAAGKELTPAMQQFRQAWLGAKTK
ncbi:M61 family metallopeptidase [Pontibacter lucknowensis]|uniref:Predicted metalloprotease, contains C-terminal PDZ domain n=1 Tax=Pontibacter lucknowensis TaxID=1077936 RepID=A0A1N6Y5L5_9BACT|nr:PDZ domain-containing protein [Pontibacter lucknowensis]SIR09870.1 Predicted metalloprotease, contains C-terminal PDZ domain [Pontibacter lucknowensis]